MLRLDEQSWIDYPPPPRTESPVQLFQGWYYIIVGLWVAVGVGTLQSPVFPMPDLSHFWLVRCIGVAMVIAGIGLIHSSRKKVASSVATGGAIILAMVISTVEVVAMVNDALPSTFMLDTTMQLGFIFWWMIALYFGEHLVHSKGQPVGGSSGQM